MGIETSRIVGEAKCVLCSRKYTTGERHWVFCKGHLVCSKCVLECVERVLEIKINIEEKGKEPGGLT